MHVFSGLGWHIIPTRGKCGKSLTLSLSPQEVRCCILDTMNVDRTAREKRFVGHQIAEACILSQALMNLKEGVCMTANLSFGNLRSKAMALGQDQEAQSVKKEIRRHVYSLLQIHQHLHPRKGNAQ